MSEPRRPQPAAHTRDIADVPAIEVVGTAAVHLMSAAAVHLGLAEDLPEHRDLDEARTLIDSLAGLLDAAAPRLGHHHAAPLRDGLRSLQLAFRPGQHRLVARPAAAMVDRGRDRAIDRAGGGADHEGTQRTHRR